jgi:hypothetical protein
VGWIDPLTKTDPKSLLVSPNPNPNKPWILAEKKIIIKLKQALSYSWDNKNKTYKLILYTAVRREEENKRRKQYKFDRMLIYSLQCYLMILKTNLSLNNPSPTTSHKNSSIYFPIENKTTTCLVTFTSPLSFDHYNL